MNKILTLVVLFSLCLALKLVAQSNQTVSNGKLTNPINFPGGCSYTWTCDNLAIGLPASGTGDIPAFTSVNTGSVPITATITAIPTAGPTNGKYAYIPNTDSYTVSAVSIADNRVVATLRADVNPSAMAVSPDGKIVYMSNSGSSTITVISTETNTVITKINLSGGSFGLCVSADGRRVYATNFGRNTVDIIDAATNTIISTLPAGQQPYGLVCTPDGSRLYVVNYISDQTVSSTVTVVNTFTGSIEAQIGVGILAAEGITINRSGSRVYVSNPVSNSVSVISTATNAVVDNITGLLGPRGVALSPDDTKLYTKNAVTYQLMETDLLTNITTAFGQAGRGSLGIDLTADGVLAYVVNYLDDNVSVINTITRSTVATIPVERRPMTMGRFISNGASCSPITFTITVNPSPSLNVGPVRGSITACEGSASITTQQFEISGSYLTGNVTSGGPGLFSVATSDVAIGGINLTPVNGIIPPTIVYVRANASNITGTINGSVMLSTPGMAPKSVPVSAFIDKLPSANALPDLKFKGGATVDPVIFSGTADKYRWTNSNPGIGLAADGTGAQISAFTATNNSDLPLVATITVVPVNDSGCEGVPVFFTISVENDPTLTVGTLSGDIKACYGVPSATAQQLSVAGRHLKGDVVVTAPTGFELSTSADRGYGKDMKLLRLNGALAATVIYVRSAATAALGVNTGDIIISTAGTNDQIVGVSSIVNTSPVVNTVANQLIDTKKTTLAVNFTGTADQYIWTNNAPSIGLAASGTGDIGAFTAINLSTKPVTATITVVPVNSSGCQGTPVVFTITVDPERQPEIIVPNTFSPNADGINDTWVIQNINSFPKAVVKVFNRLGSIVFVSQGYPQPWNGRSGNKNLPSGTYYFLITNEDKVFSGYLSIIR